MGAGSAVPATVVDNDALGQVVETSDEWIRTRTGIRERRLATGPNALTELAATAARKALAMAALDAAELDLIVLATSSPDDLFGSAASIQKALGAEKAVAFDLTAACSGFVFGLVAAAQFIRTGTYQNVLLIGADILSRWVDWSDRRTCVLFGDGAGAVVLQANSETDGLLGFELRSDGGLSHTLNLSYEGEEQPLRAGAQLDATVNRGAYAPIMMQGKEVYRFAVKRVPEVISKALFKANLDASQLDWLLLHQANQRIMDAVAQRLQIPSDRVLSNVAKYG
ncbi:MAG: beta-ketoacyl-ACP synthase 3, partial [Cyanobacteria bacterium J06641_5]